MPPRISTRKDFAAVDPAADRGGDADYRASGGCAVTAACPSRTAVAELGAASGAAAIERAATRGCAE